MSAAATAAGWLYASGRLRGRDSCGAKARYDSEIQALAHASRFVKERGGRLRAYSCDRCNGWHLTKRVDRA